MLRYSFSRFLIDCILIISSLDSSVFRLGISIYKSFPFTLRLICISSRNSTGYGPRLLEANHSSFVPRTSSSVTCPLLNRPAFCSLFPGRYPGHHRLNLCVTLSYIVVLALASSLVFVLPRPHTSCPQLNSTTSLCLKVR